MKQKVDVSKVPGFDALADDVKKIISGIEVEVPEPDYSGYVKKEVFDKKASEAADLSKQLKSKMTETELAEAENQRKALEMQTELAALKKEKTIAGYEAKYLGLGYDAETAKKSAVALAENNLDEVFSLQESFIKNAKKESVTQALNQQPGLTTGQPATQSDLAKVEEAKLKSWFGL